MGAAAEPPLEPVAVDQRHKQLEIGLLAVVRGRRHQQQVPGDRRPELPEAIALGVFDLAAEEGCRHLVRLVAHNEVPAAAGGREFCLHLLVAAQLVEPGEDQVVLDKPIAGARRLQLVVGQDLERQVKALVARPAIARRGCPGTRPSNAAGRRG